MKYHQSALRSCEVLGLLQHQSTKQQFAINRRMILTFFILCMAFCSCCTYFFVEANTFQEYALSVYISSTFMLGAVTYAIFVWKFPPILKLNDDGEKTMNGSKFHI